MPENLDQRIMLSRRLPSLLLLLTLAACAEEAAIPTRPAGGFAFAVLGDAPYTPWEERRFARALEQISGADLSFVVHVGDILGSSCADEVLRDRLALFQSLPHPVVYTPGDNEWTDCHRRSSGGFSPLERLARLRRIFFAEPQRTLGGRTMAVLSQSDDPDYTDLVENVRFTHRGVVFATVHLVGSSNASAPFRGRTEADDREVEQRTRGAVAWLRDTFADARAASARAVFVAFHADPNLGRTIPNEHFESFLYALEDEADRFDGEVVLAHGDSHVHRIDQPLPYQVARRRVPNLSRIEVHGSPDVGWIHVAVTPDEDPLFRFEPYRIPRWTW